MTWFVTKELLFSYLVCFDFFFVVFVSTFLLRPTCILWVKMYLLAFINRRGGLYGRIVTEVVSTDRTQWVLYSTRFSHTDRLSSVNKMFIWQYKHRHIYIDNLGKSVRQLTVRNQSTKDNVGALPIFAYATPDPPQQPLNFSATVDQTPSVEIVYV